ncbi:sialidase family protein [Aridibaculum aurantiacum]|uniref:sialidase family protein n=1 Tax=Aridibaculum aurantiacum TaxID=2810307 RepID=UPI001A95B2E9|nr:sialidase family protein [Aridibaculum aurantiacum]
MMRLIGLVIGLFLMFDVQAQTPAWKKGILIDEFVYDTASFPQCHSATIAETPAGLITAFFGGTREANPDVEIYVSRMVNNKWTAPVSVADGKIDGTRKACYNPVLFQVPNGELLLFYKIGKNVGDWKAFVKRSKDNGITWSEREPMKDGFLGPVKNKPVMLSNGKIISPASLEGSPGWRVHFEISDDTAKTWRKVGPINTGTDYTIIQPSILVHKDGKLQMLARSKQRALITSWSHDNGETWTKVEPSGLPNNNSGTDAVTLKNGRHLLVYNHVRPHDSLKNGKGARTPLNVAVSKDGKKWYASLILEDSPISQYSYPSVIQSADGMVHVVYTWRREKIKYVKIDPSQLTTKKIKDGAWPKFKGYKARVAGEITADPIN